jgi:hypothetical protein
MGTMRQNCSFYEDEATHAYDYVAFARVLPLNRTYVDGNNRPRIDLAIPHSLAYQSVGTWEKDPVAPISARLAGVLSILLWFGIVGAGRWIAYSWPNRRRD